MVVSHVRRDARDGCSVCGKTGHGKSNGRYASDECRTFGKTGHISAVGRHSKRGNDKENGKYNLSKTESRGSVQGSPNDQCVCCGKKGLKKFECRFKDSKDAPCGRTGHLRAVCKSVGKVRQVEDGDNPEEIIARRNRC